MCSHAFERIVFVVDSKLVHQCAACLVHADDFHFGAFTLEFDHDLVQRAYGSDVPKVCAAYVNCDFINDFLVIKRIDEIIL